MSLRLDNWNIEKIQAQAKDSGYDFSKEKIEGYRDYVIKKSKLRESWNAGNKEALKKLVAMSLEYNKIIYDRLAEL